MRLKSGYETRRARLEMVPLFDVVFLLLVFFICAMATMTVHRGVTVVLPSGKGEPEPVNNLVIALTAENVLLMNNAAVEMDEAVAAAVAQEKESGCKVLVQGDRKADLGAAIELLSRLKNAGVKSVSFLVKEGASGGQTP